jgi:hypothetical protein
VIRSLVAARSPSVSAGKCNCEPANFADHQAEHRNALKNKPQFD